MRRRKPNAQRNPDLVALERAFAKPVGRSQRRAIARAIANARYRSAKRDAERPAVPAADPVVFALGDDTTLAEALAARDGHRDSATG